MKRIIGLVVVMAIMISAFGTVAFAETPEADATQAEDLETMTPAVPAPDYGSFTGIVTEILPSDRSANAVQHVIVKGQDDSEAVFLIGADTFWASDVTAVNIGDKVTGFYDANAPMILIYPPHYNIEIMVVNLPEDMCVTVGRFDNELTSADGKLQIRIGEHTQVLTEERNMFSGPDGLAGRLLVVFHDNIDDSSPDRTMAWEIIVMYEKAVPPIYMFSPEEIEALFPLNGEIVVNGEKIEALAPYYDNGVVMVPLGAIAEALGFNAVWDDVLKGVRLGVAIDLWIGRDYYTVGKMAPIELGAAPVIIDGRTFVPLSFFGKVVAGYAAYVFEGQVVIGPVGEMQ